MPPAYMSENDLWNMLSREDQEWNGRAWSFRMAATDEVDARRGPNSSSPATVAKMQSCETETNSTTLRVMDLDWTEA
jgi:hypothetical protein